MGIWSTQTGSRLSALFLCLGLMLGIQTVFAAGGDDWVLVKRFEEQMALAKGGNALAMYEVGRMYERGRGTEASMDKAVSWFEKAAAKGQDNALARLGILYLEGEGVAQDYRKAFKYLTDAANGGAPAAQYFLALMYENGSGVKVNYNAAMSWYKRAANGGYYQARNGLERLKTKASRPTLPQPSTPSPAKSTQKQTIVAKSNKALKPNLAQGLLDTIMNGRWERNGRPAGFLPSSSTICKAEKANVVKCLSNEQTRNTGYSEITYITIARLTDFSANDEFTINYQNNVLRTHKAGEKPDVRVEEDDGDGDYGAAPTQHTNAGVNLAPQSTRHSLECSLQNEKKLVCVKDNVRTVTFTNSAASS